MQRVCGLWVWACLLRRPLLSVMGEMFTFADLPQPNRRRRLPRKIIVELNVLLDMFPMLYVDLSVPASQRVYASDASKTGGGVSCAEIREDEFDSFLDYVAHTRVMKGWYSRLRDSSTASETLGLSDTSDRFPTRVGDGFAALFQTTPFKTAISTDWRRRGEHINALEMEAEILALRHMGRSSASPLCQTCLFIENISALGALAKGRSSAPLLNRGCQQFADIGILSGIRVKFYWVPSHLNPADAPSRGAGHRALHFA